MRPLSIALHILLGLTILVLLVRQLGVRAQEVSDIRGIATHEHSETLQMQHKMQLQQDLLTGMRTKDPYVVELLARQKLNYARPGEFTPPPLAKTDR